MSRRHNLKASTVHVNSIVPSRDRAAHDFYKTPPEGTRRLLAVESFPGTVWDGSCGDGAIGRELEAAGSRVVSTDLVDYGYGQAGCDFLTYRPRFRFDHIVMNPPFTHVLEFAERALEHSPDKVAILARLLWLEGKAMRAMAERTGLARVWVFSGRIQIPKASYRIPGKGMVAYAWYVWERGHRGPWTGGWI